MTLWFEGRAVGRLTRGGDRNLLNFQYGREWLTAGDAFAISRQIPLQDVIFEDAAQVFFSNLLPEARIRRLLSGSLGVSEGNDFALLTALGGDCAGAFVLSADPPSERQGAVEPIEMEELRGIFETYPSVSVQLLKQGRNRLSLAGAQDKIAVRFDGGRLFLPQNGAPSTHILKLPNRDYAGLIENEFVFLGLARECGHPVPKARRLEREGFSVLLIERYDRVFAGRLWKRLHQEDFCQALGFPPDRKYEEEGGPGFKEFFDLLQDASSDPATDLPLLLRWLVFNVAIGNCDHHAKNLSLVRGAEGAWRLSPFYDLVCTKYYPDLHIHQALSIGGQFDGANLASTHWRKLVEDVDFSWKAFVRIASDVILSVEEGLERRLRTERDDRLRQILQVARKQARRVRV